MKNTMIELVTELEKLSDTPLRETMVKHAKEGAFHDYRSKGPCGKTYFLKCAKWFKENIGKVVDVAHADIQRMIIMESDIKEGEYDEIYTEEDSVIVLADIDTDPTISEKDRVFFKDRMAWHRPQPSSL